MSPLLYYDNKSALYFTHDIFAQYKTITIIIISLAFFAVNIHFYVFDKYFLLFH